MARSQEALIQFLRDTEEFETLETLFMLKAHFEIIEARNYSKDTWATLSEIPAYDNCNDNGDVDTNEQIASWVQVIHITMESSGEETKYYYDFIVSPEVFDLGKSHGVTGIRKLIDTVQLNENVMPNLSAAVNALSSGADPAQAAQLAAMAVPIRNKRRV